MAAGIDERPEHSFILADLARMYLTGPALLDKKRRTQSEDSQRIRRLVAFYGPSRNDSLLSESDVRRFVAARRRGDAALSGVVPAREVRQRTNQADLEDFHSMLNWGVKQRVGEGFRLLRENPLAGVSLLTGPPRRC